MEAVPGYLSLHQAAESLTLKWTPNQLMNGTLGVSELEKRWGLWDSRQGGAQTPLAPGGRPHSYPDAKNCRNRLPRESQAL